MNLNQANFVYRLGNWEYDYLYRSSPLSAAYGALKFGPWMLELKQRFLSKIPQGGSTASNKVKYAHNVGPHSILLLIRVVDVRVQRLDRSPMTARFRRCSHSCRSKGWSGRGCEYLFARSAA